MKRTLWMWLLALVVIVTHAQTTHKFSAVAYNVDGLPNKILTISINPDGPGADGTRVISQKLAGKGWDLIGVSEDFNFHSELMSAMTGYSAGTHRGGMNFSNALDIIAKRSIDTDGLDLLWKQDLRVDGEYMERWQKSNGYNDSGNDEMVKKGFRRYEVTFGEDAVVEVYVLHMDAEVEAGDIAAREVQWVQLRDAIIQRDARRPVIVIGDTNSRYTRDKVKSLFIDPINAVSNLTVQDAWVQLKRGNTYPAYGSGALMESELGDAGEVVDKILYINNSQCRAKLKADTYSLDKTIADDQGNQLADHFPVVVEFTLTVSKPNAYQLQAGSYYVQNAGTGQWLDAGGAWGTHATAGPVGHPVWLEPLSDAISNTRYNVNTHISNGEGTSYLTTEEPYMDGQAEAWRISIKDKDAMAYSVLYSVSGTNYALTASDNGSVSCEEYDAGNRRQHWCFRTREERDAILVTASAAAPQDATYLLPGAGFSRNDTEANNAWQGGPVIGWADLQWDQADFNAEKYNGKIGTLSTTKTDFDVWQSIAAPNGLYYVDVQAFYRDGSISHADSGRQEGSEVIHAQFYLNDQSVYVPSVLECAQTAPLTESDASSTFGYIPNDQPGAAAYFSRGLYRIGQYVKVTDGSLRVGIRKDHTKTEAWTCFDNFRLTYFGDAEVEDIVNGVGQTDGNAAEQTVVARQWFSLSGIRLGKPAANGAYIVRQQMADGSVRVSKVIVRP